MPRFLFAAFAVSLAVATAAFAEPVYLRGLQIGLTPAGDLKPSTRISGFEDAGRNVQVGIVQLPPAAYDELNRSMFGQAPPGATVIARESFPFESGLGYLLSATATENGVAVHRWLLLANVTAPEANFAMVVNVTVPDSARDVYGDAVVRKMLASISFRKPPIDEQLGMMPFKLTDLAGFRVMQVLPAGGVILTDGPKDDISSQPYVVVSIASGETPEAADRARFARDLLSTAPLRDLTMQSAEDMRITGRPGFEIRAQAVGLNGEPVSLVQWVRFNGGTYLRVVGASRRVQWNEMFNRFRAVRDGIELR